LLSGQGIGPDEPIQEPVQNDISIILLEMRSIKTQMNQTADRLSRLEKQLRLAQK
jgi:hypothetical protein